MPKKQPTAAKKARALQRTTGGKHTALLAEQTCGKTLDPWGVYKDTCARPPHPQDEPCGLDREFDVQAWKKRMAEQEAEAQRRWEAMSPQERQEAEEWARELEYDYEELLGDRDDFRFDH